MTELAPTGGGKRILVVEDETQVRVLMEHVLLSAGFRVDAVGSAAEALQRLEATHYHLIVTDDRLDDGRGIDIADIARERGVDTVIVTGYGLNLAKADFVRHHFLLKPVRPRELVAAVCEHLDLDSLS